MMLRTADKTTLARITDEAFRASCPRRAVEHLVHLLTTAGIPRFFAPWERFLLRGFRALGGWFPAAALPLVKAEVRRRASDVILPAEPTGLASRLGQRAAEGVRMNVNILGEAVLGEQEAQGRLEEYLAALRSPSIEVVSVKISTIFSQISLLGRSRTLSTLCDRLARLFLAAADARFTHRDGRVTPKFVYLDMEQYADMELTAAALTETLDRPGLQHATAGIALQAYLPDSYRVLLRLLAWAKRRAESGGGHIRVRLVKGANLEMERVEASLKGWPQAPFHRKIETDANFKRMLHALLDPESLAAVDVGVASHNLFDIAYALVLATEREALDKVQFEMLEGMANHHLRALCELTRNVLLYAPVCTQARLLNAVGYLLRRLDENTGPENFLRHSFQLTVAGPEWRKLEESFLASFDIITALPDRPRRTQDRRLPPRRPPAAVCGWARMANEPDTDFSLAHNVAWAERIVAQWQPRFGEQAAEVPLVIDGGEVWDGRPLGNCLDPSRPGVVVGRYRQAGGQDVDRAVACAAADRDGWRRRSTRERSELLGDVAQELRRARADLMGAALADGGKTLVESDPEVSEAVDFVEFYRDCARWWREMPSLQAGPVGVVVVVAPWNFPIAIPCGGVAAALAAGNTVILKPASDTVLPAWELCQCFWRAGVPKTALQLLTCIGGSVGSSLVNHPGVDAVVLTGGTETAAAMLRANPRLNLMAETGGKNATIVTALADREQALGHVLQSAFSHSGQKCSATSLLLLEAEVYDDPAFRRTLCDAVQSLRVGSAWELDTRIGPLIRPPGGALARALQTLEPGETWAVRPENRDGNPSLWSPGVKYAVAPGSFTHQTELFGPVLGVMRFETLREAVALVNQTGYGLTSGLESLDPREWDYWKRNVHAGNLYINRVTTGAVVLRQPFGGIGKSSFGPGLKAGGPNYVAQLLRFADSTENADAAIAAPLADLALAEWCDRLRQKAVELGPDGPTQVGQIVAAARSYEQSLREEFGRAHDHFRLLGQDNLRRYLPIHDLRIRVHPRDTPFELLARVIAACMAGSHATVSIPPDSQSPTLALLKDFAMSCTGPLEFVEEDDDALAASVRQGKVERIRYAALDRISPRVLDAASESGACVIGRPVLREGRLELLWYLREQSTSIDYHRHGNLGARADEPRAEPT